MNVEKLRALAECCLAQNCADEDEQDMNVLALVLHIQPEDVLELIAENERLKTDAERANYWKQRAKSAEGHLFANDVRAAAKALHANTTQNETPFEELSEEDRHRRFRGAWTVIATINAERNRRRPHDSQPGPQPIGEGAMNKRVDQ